VIGFMAAVDSGALNSSLAKFASDRLHRPVTFDSFRTHMLSTRPTVSIVGLRVGSPAWAGRLNLLEASRLDLGFRWSDVLSGRFIPSEISADNPQLNLLRLTESRSNWSSEDKGGQAGGGPSLSSIQQLRITNGRFTLDDRVGKRNLSGAFSYDGLQNPGFPLGVTAHGDLKGGEVQISARGAPLTRRRPKDAYPFAADVQDGATHLAVKGTSDQPLSLSGFDLSVEANGPNLGDMGYLIGVGLPNSAPYRLTTKLSRKGPTTHANDLKASVGQSDFVGSIVSDGSKPRRMIRIDLASQTLYAADVGAFLGHIPAHQVTRSVSGVASSGKGGRGPLFTDHPIDLTRFRAKDAALKITARRFIVGGVSPGRLVTEGKLDRGKFELRPFTLSFAEGDARAVFGLDLNGPHPVFRLDGTVRGPIRSLVPELSKTLNGTTSLHVHAVARGASWKQIAMNAEGQVAIRLKDGDIQKSKADVVSGAVVQGAFTALASKGARTGLPCAVADIGISRGHVRGQRILLVTDVGAALAEGGIDLASETVDATIYGRPSGFHLFAANAPVSIFGPMLHPQTKLRLSGGPSDPKGKAPDPPKIPADRASFCKALLDGPAPAPR
jgi:uncharacterized protein involved in outer membrane biogenesis